MLGALLPSGWAAWQRELLPYVLFFGLFFVIFGFSGFVVNHFPRKSGGMLDEILSEDWDHNAWDEEPDEEHVDAAEEASTESPPEASTAARATAADVSDAAQLEAVAVLPKGDEEQKNADHDRA